MPDRYDSDFMSPMDAATMVDGDTSFVALDNRRTPEDLEPGYVQVSQNMRLNQAVAGIRKGLSKQTQSIVFSTALVVPFTVGSAAVLSDGTGIFGAKLFSDPNADNLEYIVIATESKAYLFTPGASLVEIDYPANEEVSQTDTVDLFQAGGSIYLLRGDQDLPVAVSSVTSSSTTATVTTTNPHGYSSNQWVKIAGADQTEYNGTFQITVGSTASFTYTFAGSGTSPATGPITLNRVKAPLKWDGVQGDNFVALPLGFIGSGNDRIYMPASDFGILQDNRAILQYGRGEVIVTDIDNVESADSLYGVFTFANGWSDYLIGAEPYQDTNTLVFLRRSIYLLTGTNGDVSAMTSQVLTPQIGCISRRSIVTCGANVLFLSDAGVFMLQPGYELALRGNVEPLSAPITPTIQTINSTAIQQACAAYWQNRYYLAIPTNDSTRNNVVIVYNFLNGAWESIDTFPDGFYADFMVVMNLNNIATLYFVSKEGGIYAAEQNELDDFGVTNPPTQYLIDGQLRTRRLVFGTFNLKRFNRAIVNFSFDANAAFSTTAYMINPNRSKVLPSTSSTAGGTVTRPLLIGKRGYGLELLFQNTANRGQITNYSVGAWIDSQKSTPSS